MIVFVVVIFAILTIFCGVIEVSKLCNKVDEQNKKMERVNDNLITLMNDIESLSAKVKEMNQKEKITI